MDVIDVNIVKENSIVKFIAPNRTLVDGTVKKITNDFLGITINTRQDAYIVLNKGQSIELIIAHERQALRCVSIVLGSTQSDFEQAVIISIPKVILSIDRREFQRLPIVMDMEYSILPPDANYNSLNNVESKFFRSFRKTYTVNLSAGGVYFIVSKNEIDSKYALISLSLKNENIITLCEKIRTDHADDSKHFKVAYKYSDIKTHHRQLILDFVTEKSKENKSS
ncbi:pilus assembly protein PilZ [Clostridium sp.]|uniref:pilus assembly protein PilZ n=1 Tax=Clostridium sp. TaxID=1506 RepID=UPI0026381CBC|nr:pilus assembly protein PilZ [Clostridium sp.]